MEIIFDGDENDELLDFLQELEEESASEKGIKIDVKQGETSLAGSGMVEITQLILTLGSSGAIAALVVIWKKYLETRPNGKLVAHYGKDGHIKTLQVDGANQDTLEEFARTIKYK